MTRLYTTMSADEMTVDPLFTFNPELPTVSNVHTAERIIECNPDIDQFDAPWRIEFPQGGVIRGTADQVGTWPNATADMPSNLLIRRLGESGAGRVIEDNTAEIGRLLAVYNASLPTTPGSRPGASPNPDASGERKSGGCTIADPNEGPSTLMLAGIVVVGLVMRRRRSMWGEA